MIYPMPLTLSLARYIALNKMRGRHRFPLVLMLEPTFLCNLACSGCGRIRENKEILGRMLSADECLASADEAGSPVVCLTGGEPLLHPEITKIVEGLLARNRFVYLATNGIELEKSLPKFRPHSHFSFAVHMDGLASTHDKIVERDGVFDRALAGIKAAKGAGFRVRTNTTVYKGTSMAEIEALFAMLGQIGVDGNMVAPAFSYEAVDSDIFMTRDEVISTFGPLYEHRNQYRLYNTPIYLEFLAGRRSLPCLPWSTPTRNPKGWKKPCYLITDGYCDSFEQLWEETPWDSYGVGKDPRCANCMVHVGFEAGALDQVGKSVSDLWNMARWNFVGH